jgi:6-pyruvoyl-tetrahydropterin synthase
MYAVRVRDHIMIAHSLPDPFFGPASNMHGATYVVDAEFKAENLDVHNVVIDIGIAQRVLGEVLDKLKYKNLDQESQFEGKLTTTEFLAQYIHLQVADAMRATFQGSLKITLGESHVAWASYENDV